MAAKHYYVVAEHGRWKLEVDGQAVGFWFATQPAAVRAAIDLAHADGLGGHEAEVRLRDAGGAWRTIWRAGRDPYPPPD